MKLPLVFDSLIAADDGWYPKPAHHIFMQPLSHVLAIQYPDCTNFYPFSSAVYCHYDCCATIRGGGRHMR